MARVLIAGFGYVGSLLAEQLRCAGHEVWGLRRSAALLPAGVAPLRADLTQSLARDLLPPDLDHAFVLLSAGAYEDRRYEQVYVQGTQRLIDALAATSPRLARFVFVSSTSVYGQDGGEWVDEDSPAEPRDFAGRRLLEAEARVRSAPWPASVVRFGGIYGPGRRRLIESVRSGAARLPPPGARFTNRIQREDCAGVLAHLLALEAPPALLLGVDDEPADEREVLCWLADRIGVARPPVADAGAPAARIARERGRAPTNKRCSNARLRATGYVLRYPSYREGYAAALAENG